MGIENTGTFPNNINDLFSLSIFPALIYQYKKIPSKEKIDRALSTILIMSIQRHFSYYI